jgi:hypothetical protein
MQAIPRAAPSAILHRLTQSKHVRLLPVKQKHVQASKCIWLHQHPSTPNNTISSHLSTNSHSQMNDLTTEEEATIRLAALKKAALQLLQLQSLPHQQTPKKAAVKGFVH